MTLSLIKPSGWAFGELLTSAQMEALDASQAQAIDGTGGGTYAPIAKIIINGQGLQVTSLTVTGTLMLNGNTTIGNSSSDTLSVLATSTFSAPVTLNDVLTVNQNAGFFSDVIFHSGASVSMLADVQLGDDSSDTITIDGTLTANAPATFNDTAEFWGNVSVHSGGYLHALGDFKAGNSPSNDLALLGSLSTILNFAGSGRVPMRVNDNLIDADATVSAADGNVIRLPSVVSGGRNYTLTKSSAQKGDFMVLYQAFGGTWTHDVIIRDDSNHELYRFVSGASASFIIFFFRGGAWETAFATND